MKGIEEEEEEIELEMNSIPSWLLKAKVNCSQGIIFELDFEWEDCEVE